MQCNLNYKHKHKFLHKLNISVSKEMYTCYPCRFIKLIFQFLHILFLSHVNTDGASSYKENDDGMSPFFSKYLPDPTGYMSSLLYPKIKDDLSFWNSVFWKQLNFQKTMDKSKIKIVSNTIPYSFGRIPVHCEWTWSDWALVESYIKRTERYSSVLSCCGRWYFIFT
jgi:hypothetical protein